MSQTGVEGILRKLGSIKAAIDNGMFINAVENWATVEFIPRARALAPVKTGYLRDSIQFTATSKQVFVFADAPYSGEIELGTYKMLAQPFLRPAFKASRPLLSKYTRRVIQEVLR